MADPTPTPSRWRSSGASTRRAPPSDLLDAGRHRPRDRLPGLPRLGVGARGRRQRPLVHAVPLRDITTSRSGRAPRSASGGSTPAAPSRARAQRAPHRDRGLVRRPHGSILEAATVTEAGTQPIQQPVPAAPPRWKQAVTIWVGFFPTNLAASWLLASFPGFAEIPLVCACSPPPHAHPRHDLRGPPVGHPACCSPGCSARADRERPRHDRRPHRIPLPPPRRTLLRRDRPGGCRPSRADGRRRRPRAALPPTTCPRPASGVVLVPWPNRIRDGKYSFDGEDLQLAISEPKFGNASHGLLRFGTYQAIEHTDDRSCSAPTLCRRPATPSTCARGSRTPSAPTVCT